MGRTAMRLAVIVALVASLLGPAAASASGAVAPPSNDDFDAATVVAGLGFTDAIDVVDATEADDDPFDCYSTIRSVWYAFTPAESGWVQANTFGSDFDTVLGVYQGVRGDLEELGCNDDAAGTLESRVRWQASAGQTYYIMAASLAFDAESQLRVAVDAAVPGNDLRLSLANQGVADENYGTADVSGSVSCARPTDLVLFGLVVQEQGRDWAGGYFTEELRCNGTVSWTTTAFPDEGSFARGAAIVEAIVFTEDDDEDYAFRNVVLRPAPNGAPVATADSYTVDQGQLLTVPRPGVLSNDFDPEGFDLTARLSRLPGKSAAFDFQSTGSFSYRSEAFSFGADSFSYIASDGRVSSRPTTATVYVRPNFSDVPQRHTFYDDIRWVGSRGITRGCNPPLNYRYCPEGTVTRGQLAALITRALNLPDTLKDHFSDDDGSPFENDINRLASAGIVRGCNPPTNTAFCPDQRVTRAQMASILVRAFRIPAATGPDAFSDDNSSVHERDINALAAMGIARGCNPPANSRFCPGNPVTRGQMAAFIRRAMGVTTGTSSAAANGLAEYQLDTMVQRLDDARS